MTVYHVSRSIVRMETTDHGWVDYYYLITRSLRHLVHCTNPRGLSGDENLLGDVEVFRAEKTSGSRRHLLHACGICSSSLRLIPLTTTAIKTSTRVSY